MSVEIEFKFRVDDDATLQKLQDAAGGEQLSCVEQHNHFFDSASSALDRAKFVLRLRVQGPVGETPAYIVTAKGPGMKSSDGTLSKKAEEEITISADDAEACFAGDVSPLALLRAQDGGPSRAQLLDAMEAALDGDAVREAGRFDNNRTTQKATLPTGDGDAIALTLEFDRTVFPGDIRHYEVEVEVAEEDTDRAGRAMRKLLDDTGVQQKSAPGKAKRFFKALRGEAI